MSSFTDQVHVSISSFEHNVIYYDLKLSQKMADHHYFSFMWQYTGKPLIDPEDQEKSITKFIGSEVIFTFKVNGIKVMSKGIITGLDSIDEHGSPAGLYVLGKSHTAIIDDQEKSRIFLNKNLQQLALEIFDEENSGEFYQQEAIKPTYHKTFAYQPQYNESNFNFIKRLAARYGQWFYFDGMRMQFGQTKASKVKLINGSSLHRFTIKANLISHKTSFGSYDYNTAANIRNSSPKTDTGSRDRFAISMGWNQGSVTRSDLSIGTYTNNAQNKEEIDEMVQLQTAGRDANSVFYSGISYFPIGLGEVFTIQNKTVEHDLVAIEVIHLSEVNGNYKCEFRAIPADVAAPHYTNVTVFAVAETQSAKVIDNNDPEKLGRLKVQFYWNGWETKSDWMRMVQNYSGPGRGTYWRPEIEDEVLISFEGGNVERPYVLGSHYNGQAQPEFFDPQNMIKAIRMRFGQLLKFVEKTGIWLSDPSGNELHMNEETKSTTLTVPETLTLNCKNLIINASESIITTAGSNIMESAGVDKSTTVGMMHNLNIGGDSMTNVKGELHEKVEGNRSSTSKKSISVHDDYQMNVTKDKKIHSEGDLHVNSGENTNMN